MQVFGHNAIIHHVKGSLLGTKSDDMMQTYLYRIIPKIDQLIWFTDGLETAIKYLSSNIKIVFSILAYPVAGSNPHFLHGDEQLVRKIDGMKPDAKKYTSYVAIEPVSSEPNIANPIGSVNQIVQTD